MLIDSPGLEDLILEVAESEFDRRVFRRRPLIEAVEATLQSRGLWEKADDTLSGSAGLKSRGLAQIDYRISDLKRKRKLLNPKRDGWKLP